MMKHYLIIAFALILLSGTTLIAAPLALEDEAAQLSYSLGYQIGGDFKQQGVGINPEAVVQGIQDALSSSEPLLSQQQMNDLLVTLKKKVVSAQRQEYFKDSRKFMADNLQQDGVKELSNGGVQYKVIQSGAGPSPKPEDTVMIRFTTSRSDGTSIPSAGDSKEPRAYPVKKMLPGLQAALVKMKVGDVWSVFVPPSGRNEMMEKGGVLIYQIELLGIQSPAADKTK